MKITIDNGRGDTVTLEKPELDARGPEANLIGLASFMIAEIEGIAQKNPAVAREAEFAKQNIETALLWASTAIAKTGK